MSPSWELEENLITMVDAHKPVCANAEELSARARCHPDLVTAHSNEAIVAQAQERITFLRSFFWRRPQHALRGCTALYECHTSSRKDSQSENDVVDCQGELCASIKRLPTLQTGPVSRP